MSNIQTGHNKEYQLTNRRDATELFVSIAPDVVEVVDVRTLRL